MRRTSVITSFVIIILLLFGEGRCQKWQPSTINGIEIKFDGVSKSTTLTNNGKNVIDDRNPILNVRSYSYGANVAM